MIAVALGLSSGLLWGSADFFGGREARGLPALAVALWSQLIGGAALLVVVLASSQRAPLEAMAWGAVAGTAGGTALVLFYRGLAGGTMSIVAPVSACGALVPVMVALGRGDVPPMASLVGIGFALTGIVVVSLPVDGPRVSAHTARTSVLLGLGAAAGFGLFYVFVDVGSGIEGASPLAVVLGTRVGSLTMLAAFVLVGRRRAPWPGARMPVVGAVGIADTTANTLFAVASTFGNLGVVGVLASLYPVATVALARIVLDERLVPLQTIGVSLALGGVVLLAAGS